METYNGWSIYTEIPDGWWVDKSVGAPIANHAFIVNGSPLKGGKRALLKLPSRAPIEPNYERVEVNQPADKVITEMHKDAPKMMNRLARENEGETAQRYTRRPDCL